MKEDWFLLPFELKLQEAHAQTLCAANIYTDQELQAVTDGLRLLREQHVDTPCPESPAEDIHTWVESALVEQVGEPGRKIHTARSRNDQVATLLKMYVIASGDALVTDLAGLIRVCCEQAKAWSDIAFPLQTHCQFAAPGSVGFWSLRYAASFGRVRDSLTALCQQWRRFCPLGAGAVAGSSVPIDRKMQATLLGFESPSPNALDSTSTRDECLELLHQCAMTALHLQSLATDVIAFSQTPFAWTQYPPAFGTGSSMMPNKTNPDAMELLRGHAKLIAAAHPQAFALMQGLPSGYNRDLQCIKPIVHDTVVKLRDLLAMTTEFVGALDFDRERCEAACEHGFIDATLRMEQNVVNGTPLRDAHHEIAAAVAAGGFTGEAPTMVAYQTIGSASPAEVDRVADQLLSALAEGNP